jgi:hypothetical protein
MLATIGAAGLWFVAGRAEECTPIFIGVPPDSANNSSGAIHSGVGQTFWAADTLITSLTVWRVASQDSGWTIGMHPYIMGTDSTGMPDINQMIHEGPTLIILNGDGIHPVEFTWTFDPPILLPRPGKYAFYLYQDPCRVYFDVPASESPEGSNYPDGEFWSSDRSWGCTPIPWMASFPHADMVFQVEFCSLVSTPVRRTSWGQVKLLYR